MAVIDKVVLVSLFSPHLSASFFFSLRFYLFTRKRGRERNIDGLPLVCAPAGDWTRDSGMCPDRDSNPGPSFCGMTHNPQSHTGQGAVCFHLL